MPNKTFKDKDSLPVPGFSKRRPAKKSGYLNDLFSVEELQVHEKIYSRNSQATKKLTTNSDGTIVNTLEHQPSFNK